MNDEVSIWQIVGIGLASLFAILILWVVLASAIFGFRVATAGLPNDRDTRCVICKRPREAMGVDCYHDFDDQLRYLESQIAYLRKMKGPRTIKPMGESERDGKLRQLWVAAEAVLLNNGDLIRGGGYGFGDLQDAVLTTYEPAEREAPR